jgi:ATP-dependent Clp protease ATP-binding subunit ClpC
MKATLMKEIERFFRPEFINRLDDVIAFKPLTRDNLISIVDYETDKVRKRLTEQGWTLTLDQSAKDFLIDKGFNPDYGARPLRRAISQYVEDPLSEALLSGEFQGKSIITVTKASVPSTEPGGEPEDRLIFKSEDAPPPEPAKPVGAGAEST